MISDELKAKLSSSNGQTRTAIFREICPAARKKAGYDPVYTMFDSPREGLPSAYQIYMAASSEYEAAMNLVGSWAHWEKLMANDNFMNGPGKHSGSGWRGLASWREEKRLMEEAKAVKLLEKAAAAGSVTAAKLLLDRVKEETRGRPKKVKAQQETEKQVKNDKLISESLNVIELMRSNARSGQSETGASKEDN